MMSMLALELLPSSGLVPNVLPQPLPLCSQNDDFNDDVENVDDNDEVLFFEDHKNEEEK